MSAADESDLQHFKLNLSQTLKAEVMKFSNLKAQILLFLMLDLAVKSPAQNSQTSQEINIEDEVVKLLQKQDVGDLANEPRRKDIKNRPYSLDDAMTSEGAYKNTVPLLREFYLQMKKRDALTERRITLCRFYGELFITN